MSSFPVCFYVKPNSPCGLTTSNKQAKMFKPISPLFKTDWNSHFITVDEETGEAHYGGLKPGSPVTYSNVLRIGIPLSYSLREDNTGVSEALDNDRVNGNGAISTQIIDVDKEQDVYLHPQKFKSKRKRQTSYKKKLKQKRKAHKVKHFREKDRDEGWGEVVQLQDTQGGEQYIRGLNSRVFWELFGLYFPDSVNPDTGKHEGRLGERTLPQRTTFLLNHYEDRLIVMLKPITTYLDWNRIDNEPYTCHDLWLATVGLNKDVRVDLWNSWDYGPYELEKESVSEDFPLYDDMEKVAYDICLQKSIKAIREVKKLYSSG